MTSKAFFSSSFSSNGPPLLKFIAELDDTSVEAVKKRIQRARKLILSELEGNAGGVNE